MRYLTDRKRAEGKGASGTGTEHHWRMQVSSVALAFLLPVWLFIFGSAIGQPHAEVVATFGRPFPAILTALVLVISMRHFVGGATIMLEDYTRGYARKFSIIAVTSLGWVIAVTGLYALVRMTLL